MDWPQVVLSSALFGAVMLATYGVALLLMRMPTGFAPYSTTLSEPSAKKARRIVAWLCLIFWLLFVLNMILFHVGL
jgi:hypothetical protein